MPSTQLREMQIRRSLLRSFLSLDDTPKKLAWKQHKRLLNIDFLWSQNLPHVDPVAGPAQFITPDHILKSL